MLHLYYILVSSLLDLVQGNTIHSDDVSVDEGRGATIKWLVNVSVDSSLSAFECRDNNVEYANGERRFKIVEKIYINPIQDLQLDYSRLRADGPLNNAEGTYTFTIKYLNTSIVLDNNIVFSCEAGFRKGSITKHLSSNARLIVKGGPILMIDLAAETFVKEGDSASLNIEVMGNPMPNVTWTSTAGVFNESGVRIRKDQYSYTYGETLNAKSDMCNTTVSYTARGHGGVTKQGRTVLRVIFNVTGLDIIDARADSSKNETCVDDIKWSIESAGECLVQYELDFRNISHSEKLYSFSIIGKAVSSFELIERACFPISYNIMSIGIRAKATDAWSGWVYKDITFPSTPTSSTSESTEVSKVVITENRADKGKNNIGIIAGVVGALVVVVCIIILVIFITKRKTPSNKSGDLNHNQNQNVEGGRITTYDNQAAVIES